MERSKMWHAAFLSAIAGKANPNEVGARTAAGVVKHAIEIADAADELVGFDDDDETDESDDDAGDDDDGDIGKA